MSQFNGWTIVPVPGFPPCPRSIEWMFSDTVGAVRSPFSLQQQIQNWGSALLKASVSYQSMNNVQARAWMAFLASCQGIASVFLMGDPLQLGPQNPSASGGAVNGSNQTGYILETTSTGMTPGDWIQIGVRLYLVTSVSGGELGIWPQIRESPAGGSTIGITNTQGLFRLAKNDRKISVNDVHVYGLTFEIEEAI